MSQTAALPSLDRSAPPIPTMVHLGLPDIPNHTFCGAKVRRELPHHTAVDCVVCAEMALADGWTF
jgi:hypothetical protein